MLFLPDRYLKKVLPKGFFKKKMLTRARTVKQELVRALLTATTLKEEEVKESLGAVVDFYQQKIEKLKDEGSDKPVSEALNGEKLLKQRVENIVTWKESQELKEKYKGRKYIWLPSSSKEPRQLHQLRYGKVYTVGDGLFPAEDYGCKCGALILDSDEKDVLTSKQEREIEEQRDFNLATEKVLNKLKGSKNG